MTAIRRSRTSCGRSTRPRSRRVPGRNTMSAPIPIASTCRATPRPLPSQSAHPAAHRMGHAEQTRALIMGQSPGTHWYHAHKHGSTTINVSNGMTGAFIIEGAYDDALNGFYGTDWTRRQPVLVLNQLGVSPNLMRTSGAAPGHFGQRPTAAQDHHAAGRSAALAHRQHVVAQRHLHHRFSAAEVTGRDRIRTVQLEADRPGRRSVHRHELPEQREPAACHLAWQPRGYPCPGTRDRDPARPALRPDDATGAQPVRDARRRPDTDDPDATQSEERSARPTRTRLC